jgi:hypothetical protein
MYLNKLKKRSVLQMSALLLTVVFVMMVGACPADDIVSIDRSALNAKITEAENARFGIEVDTSDANVAQGSYWVTRAALDALNGAISAAKNAKSAINQAEIDIAERTLNAAIAAFNSAKAAGAKTSGFTKEQLLALITAAKAAKAGIVENTDAANVDKGTDWVTVAEMTALNAAITEAESVATRETGIDGAYTALNAAITTFNNAKKAGSKTSEAEPDPEITVDYGSSLKWGTSFDPLNLGLTPGNDTTEIRLNWINTTGTTSLTNKVAQVRFIKGTREKGTGLIEKTGEVASASSSNATYHRVTVTGLEPGANYQYSVCQDGTNWSPMYDFKVPAATGTWKFAVISDSQINSGGALDSKSRITGTSANGWSQTITKIVEKSASFIVSCGDQVDSTSTSTVVNEYKSFFDPPGLRSLPLAHTAGNHDTATNFRYYYNRPNDPNYNNSNSGEWANYYYLYNNILFVVLNTSSYSPSTTLINTFVSTITAAKTAHAGKYDWLIVQHHKSTASVAEHCADTDVQAWVVNGFETKMSDLGVDFVLAGHDHVYARSYPLQGMGNGAVSLPDKTTTTTTTTITDNGPVTEATATAIYGKPIYLTFGSSSGQKYYQVSADKYSTWSGSVQTNTAYPYLGANASGVVTQSGSTSYLQGNLPVSNAAFVQPYIPSYTIVEVNGNSITFSTYAIANISGKSSGASLSHNFQVDRPYDKLTVTK